MKKHFQDKNKISWCGKVVQFNFAENIDQVTCKGCLFQIKKSKSAMGHFEKELRRVK